MASVTSRDVIKKFGEFTAVSDLDLEVRDKEFLVLLGPSGCGKTTTMRMIAGLEEVTAGDIFIGEDRVNDVLPKYRDVAMVFQSYALYPHLTVAENIGYPLQIRKVPAEERTAHGHGSGAARGARRPARPAAEGTFRRPAPTRRAGARHHPHARKSF